MPSLRDSLTCGRPHAVSSELIIGALLPEQGKLEPSWLCWLKHSQYLSIITQHTIRRDELPVLAALITEHQQAFAKVRHEGSSPLMY